MKFSKILLASTALFALSQMVLSSCGTSSSADLEKIELIPVKTSKDGKWSMINDKGEIVYDSEFKNRPTASYNGLFTVEEGKGLTVYKVGGNKPEAVSGLENLKYAGFLEDGLMPVTFPDKRISIVDADGKIKFELGPIKGAEVKFCTPAFMEGLLVIKTEDDKFGYLDKSGNLAINCEYDDAYIFSEGLALVGKTKGEDNYANSYSVIDKSGKVQFNFKEEYFPLTYQFSYGYILAQKDDRIYLINSKGEENKLSSKISSIRNYNDKYIIFANEDGEVGVANFNDEIIIRAKYDQIIFGNGDFFLAKKDSDDKDFVKIYSDGEESDEKIDYENIFEFGHFGYFAKEGKTYVLLNEDFKKKGKEEFFDINYNWFSELVYSDYFNADEVASTMVNMIENDKVDYLQNESPASKILSDKSPSDYTFENQAEFKDLRKEGFRYNISVIGMFSENLTNYFYDPQNYDRIYYWNPSSRLSSIFIKLKSEFVWGKKGQDSLKKALLTAGYKLLKDGKNGESYATAFKNGNVIAIATSGFNDQSAYILLFDSQYESNLLSTITSLDGSENDNAHSDFDFTAADSSACDTVALVEETVVEMIDTTAAW